MLRTPPNASESRPPLQPNELRLEAILLDLALTDPRDTANLVRRLVAALQIVSSDLPATTPSREVWNQRKRESFRSRTVWKRWILRQLSPHLGDGD